MKQFPEKCRKNIRRITRTLHVSEDTAYGMLVMTAALMDLYPEDDVVAEMVMQDCGVEEVPA